MQKYYAHSKPETQDQTQWHELKDHLLGTCEKAGIFADKIGLKEAGEIIGLLHDLGKYSEEFQEYIKKNNGDSDNDEGSLNSMKGKIDHSTAGAQWVFSQSKTLYGQILALCIASHHSGLIDCLDKDSKNNFDRRIKKPYDETHLIECVKKLENEKDIYLKLASLDKAILNLHKKIKNIKNNFKVYLNPSFFDLNFQFQQGMFVKFLFSCLVDADRLDSASFCDLLRFQKTKVFSWDKIIEAFEKNLSKLDDDSFTINKIRREISKKSFEKSESLQGFFRFTVPTGGGKTLSSLRFALYHAKKHNLDHIIYVIPYVSIIEQNAEAIRKILNEEELGENWVLEHHSYLEPETQTWFSKLTSENWDCPIILTTMAQFLEVLFGGGTRGVRRLHQISNSVLIFDEIQTLPVRCVHLFNSALKFFVDHAKTTVVLCTATQPLLDELKNEKFEKLTIPKENEIAGDSLEVRKLFLELQRVQVINKCKLEEWSKDEILNFIKDQFDQTQSCLMVVNTKKWAKDIYQSCKSFIPNESIFHLSTNQCAAHRKNLIRDIKQRLKNGLPVFCVSTQLIEAGVDISFKTVIRALAGMDSIAQAAGRCNRNGELKDNGKVFIVNLKDEKIQSLNDIKIGKETVQGILKESKGDASDFLYPQKMEQYFRYYFYEREKDMAYTVPANDAGENTTLFNLLSSNPTKSHCDGLRQSFMLAGKIFESIEAPTQAVIVPYEDGENLIEALKNYSAKFMFKDYKQAIKKAQRYTINVFPNVFRSLEEYGLIEKISEGIFCLVSKNYYDSYLGLLMPEDSPFLNE